MHPLRISPKLITAAAGACQGPGLSGWGHRAGVPRRRRRPGRACLAAAVVAALAAVGVPGLSQSVALASSSSVPTWTRQAPATHPQDREGGAMAYDAATGTAVLFGGLNGRSTRPLYTTWTWDGTTWTQRHPAAHPPARFDASMAYDAATGNVVLFGGGSNDGGCCKLGGTWVWDGTTWTQRHPATSPPARSLASMAYDAATGNVVLFGGVGRDGGASGDTWVWDGTTWTQQHPATSPPARAAASMAYDAATGNVVLFSARFGVPGDTWAWDGTTWTQQHPATSPPRRFDASMAYDAATGNVVLFGGLNRRDRLSAAPGPGTARPGPSSTRPPTRLPGTKPRWPTTRAPATWSCSAASTESMTAFTTPGPGDELGPQGGTPPTPDAAARCPDADRDTVSLALLPCACHLLSPSTRHKSPAVTAWSGGRGSRPRATPQALPIAACASRAIGGGEDSHPHPARQSGIPGQWHFEAWTARPRRADLRKARARRGGSAGPSATRSGPMP